jgi:hypothetical protein
MKGPKKPPELISACCGFIEDERFEHQVQEGIAKAKERLAFEIEQFPWRNYSHVKSGFLSVRVRDYPWGIWGFGEDVLIEVK